MEVEEKQRRGTKQRHGRTYRRRKRRRRIKMVCFLILTGAVTAGAYCFFKAGQGEERQIVSAEVRQEGKEKATASAQKEENTKEQGKEAFHEKTRISLSSASVQEGDLILVNAMYGVPEAPVTDISSIYEGKNDSYYTKDRNVSVKEKVLEALNRMLENFERQSGRRDVMTISGYRTEDYQRKLYRQDLKEKHTSSSEYVAKPGYSEHQTGLAVDFGVYKPSHTNQEYDGTGKYRWINEHCSEYGFVVRYPEGKQSKTQIGYEPWHFRYVGLPHSQIMAEEGLCLEEYLEFIKSYSQEQPYQWQDSAGTLWEIFHAGQEETEVWIPEGKSYEISGNNVDGFFVTVH